MSLEHGESFISVNADLITIKVKGAFNREGIIKGAQELKLVVNSFQQKKFKLLFDYLEMEGATPDAYDEINQCNVWLNTKNMVAKAVLINSPINSSLLQTRLPATKLQNIKRFDEKSHAISWLALQQ
jgi:hypothetical protein